MVIFTVMDLPYLMHDIVDLSEGNLLQKGVDSVAIKTLLIDSRRVSNPAESVFIAVKGDRHNGHHFINEAYQKGIRAFIVDEDINLNSVKDSWVVKVPNTLNTLQLLAHKHRKSYKFPIIESQEVMGKRL